VQRRTKRGGAATPNPARAVFGALARGFIT